MARNTVAAWEQKNGVPTRHLRAVRDVLGAALSWAESGSELDYEDWLSQRWMQTGEFPGMTADYDNLIRDPQSLPKVSADELRRARALRGLDRPAMAEALGTSPRTIAAWEADGVPVARVRDVEAKLDDELALLRGQAVPDADLSRVPTGLLLAELSRRAE